MPPSAEPGISVVIATHGRAALLEETLDALAAQTRRDVEIVVVDDESADETPAVLARRGVRSIRVTRRGPGRARQEGWRAARAPIVAFTDDDCVPTPEWLEELVRPIEEGDADFVQGRTLPRPDQLDRIGPWSRTQRVEAENGFYQTCNMAYRRDVLDALGGFREDFSGPRTAGEDTDLAWRARAAGYRSGFAPAALVHHVVWASSYREFLRDRRRRAMVVQVIKFHPDSRRLAYRRWFYRPSHVRTLGLLAALGAAALVRRWLPAALLAAMTGAYLARTRRSGRPVPERALHLVRVLTADTAEVAAFAASSVRYRTLLL